MMVGARDRAPLGIGLSSEISAGILAGGGPARVPIRFPRYPVFKVPGAPSAPPRRFLPSAAQGDILRDLSPAVKNFFQKVLSGFESFEKPLRWLATAPSSQMQLVYTTECSTMMQGFFSK